MAGPSDPGLIEQAVAGDEVAFAALVGPHQRAVFRHCYRMLGSGADAEDATQDTLERAWRRLATYDGSGPFGAWLQRIATNMCLDGLRARRTRLGPAGFGRPAAPGTVPGPPDPELAWVEPVSDAELNGADPQDALIRREEISLAFVAALQLLPPRQRAALLLHDVLGFTHAEVGEVLGVGSTAVNSLLSRARASVRAAAGSPPPEHQRSPGAAAARPVRPGLAARRHRRAGTADRRGRPVLDAPAHRLVPGPRSGRRVHRERHLRRGPAARHPPAGRLVQRPARVRHATARTATAAWRSAACRSSRSATWTGSRSSPPWCPIATLPSRSAAGCRPPLRNGGAASTPGVA